MHSRECPFADSSSPAGSPDNVLSWASTASRSCPAWLSFACGASALDRWRVPGGRGPGRPGGGDRIRVGTKRASVPVRRGVRPGRGAGAWPGAWPGTGWRRPRSRWNGSAWTVRTFRSATRPATPRCAPSPSAPCPNRRGRSPSSGGCCDREARLHLLEHGLSPHAPVARWQHRVDPLQRRLAGGCHLNRDPVTLVTNAGFALERSRSATCGAPNRGVGSRSPRRPYRGLSDCGARRPAPGVVSHRSKAVGGAVDTARRRRLPVPGAQWCGRRRGSRSRRRRPHPWPRAPRPCARCRRRRARSRDAAAFSSVRMDPEFGRPGPEDEPSVVGVHGGPSQHVTEEGPSRIRVGGVDDRVDADDHARDARSSPPPPAPRRCGRAGGAGTPPMWDDGRRVARRGERRGTTRWLAWTISRAPSAPEQGRADGGTGTMAGRRITWAKVAA